MVYSPFPFIILLTVLITSLLFEGASNGLKQMFLPTTKGLLSVKVVGVERGVTSLHSRLN